MGRLRGAGPGKVGAVVSLLQMGPFCDVTGARGLCHVTVPAGGCRDVTTPGGAPTFLEPRCLWSGSPSRSHCVSPSSSPRPYSGAEPHVKEARGKRRLVPPKPLATFPREEVEPEPLPPQAKPLRAVPSPGRSGSLPRASTRELQAAPRVSRAFCPSSSEGQPGASRSPHEPQASHLWEGLPLNSREPAPSAS